LDKRRISKRLHSGKYNFFKAVIKMGSGLSPKFFQALRVMQTSVWYFLR
jgi:hypothetical protein